MPFNPDSAQEDTFTPVAEQEDYYVKEPPQGFDPETAQQEFVLGDKGIPEPGKAPEDVKGPRTSWKIITDEVPLPKNWLEELADYKSGYEYGAILPYRKSTETGESEFAAPGLIKEMAGAVLAPRRAYEGVLDVNSPEAVQQAINMGGMLQLGPVMRNLTKPGFSEPMPAVMKPNPARVGGAVVPDEPMPAVMQPHPARQVPVGVSRETVAPIAPMSADEVMAATAAQAAARKEPINLLQFDSDAGVASLMEATVGKFTPEQIAQAKRGKISWPDAQKMADITGYDATYFLGAKPGTVLNAETIQRFGNVIDASSKELVGLAQKALGENASNVDLLNFKKAQLVHSALVNKFVGASSEAGRTLNQLKAAKGTMDQAKYLDRAITRMGGTENLADMAKIIADAATKGPLELQRVLAKGDEFKWSNVFFEAWKAGLLTGVKTQVKNLASNLATNLLSVPERAVAATVGATRTFGKKDADRVYFSEVYGMVEGYKDTKNAFGNFIDAMKNEDYLMHGGGKADVFQKYITAEYFRNNFNIPPGSKAETIIDNTGKVWRVPFRVLNATDVGFKTVAASQQLRALAYREGIKKGIAKEDLESYVAERIQNPSSKEMESAMDWAHYLTFTNELGNFGKAFQSMVHSHPAWQINVPFTGTPINLAKFFVDRTPLALLSRTTRAKIKAGGADADMALGQMIAGTGMMWGIADLVQDGIISQPTSIEPGQAMLERQAGYKPFAWKTKDGYIPIDSIDPIGSMVAMSASLVRLGDFYENEVQDKPKLAQWQNVHAYVSDTVANVFIDKTYASGLSNLLQGLQSVKGIEHMGEAYVASVVPTIARDINIVIDPTMYRAGSIPEKLQAVTPFINKDTLLPELDMWGEPRIRQGVSMVSPWKESKLTEDKATLARIKYGIAIPRPDVEIRATGLDLTADEQYIWTQMQGKYAREFMEPLVNSPLFDAPDTPALLKVRQAALLKANENASRMATSILSVQKMNTDRALIMEEKQKQLFPKPKRKDIVQ